MLRFDPILESFVAKDNRDVLALRKLSEDERVEMSKGLVESVYKATAERAMGLDYDDVAQSEGDITKIQDYATLKASIDLLQGMQSNLKEKIQDLDTVVSAHQNLMNNAGNFEQGFRVGNTGVILLYNNMAMSLVCSVSFLISTTVDYVKEPVGDYSAHFRTNASSHRGFPTVMLDSLAKFNTLAVNGDLAKFFEVSFSKRALVGSTVGVSAAVLIGVGVAFSIVPLIREAVYQFYHTRVKFSDHLRLQASFLEMNRAKLGSNKDMKKTAQKQETVMKNLQTLADKIDVDQKNSTKRAENDIKRENNTISMNSPAVAAPSHDGHDSLL